MISIVYLFWVPYGINYAYKFLDSYINSGENEVLFFFIIKGEINNEDFKKIQEYCALCNINPIFFQIKNEGLDIDSYFEILDLINTKYVMFFNTTSVILVKNWLSLFINNFLINDNIGIIGATGSLASNLSITISKLKKIRLKFNNLREIGRLIIGIVKYRIDFNLYPNFHIRTNAFMIETNLLKAYPNKTFKTKYNAHKFEHGKNSLTNFILNKGKLAYVVDKNMNLFDSSNINQSQNFWKGNQKDLIIDDKQTLIYQNSSQNNKIALENLIWHSYIKS